MPAFYVLHQGTKLRLENRRLLVVQGEEILASTPLSHVSQVVLFGNIGLTTPVMGALMAGDKEVIFLTRYGDFRGRLVGSLMPHVPLRQAQYRYLDQPDFVLQMAMGFVTAKLQHQRTFLLRHNRKKRDADIEKACRQIGSALEAVPRKTTLNALLGLEGTASRAYFRGFRDLFDPIWRFESRTRRPPRDPVNVLLSFGYTLLVQDCRSAVQSVGLDPFAGYLHSVSYNRPSMALDLAEEFRVIVDGLALWCCNSGVLTLQDFTPGPPERPVVLSDAGIRAYVQVYEKRLDRLQQHPGRGMQFQLRQCIVEQVRQIAERVRDGQPGYQGMGFR
jgi:CRISPR-associated protein Cas1